MRPRQMRRNARRMRRYGMQPMVVINSGDSLPDVFAVLFGRWLWRYRSELAPFTLAMVTVLVSLVLHLTHPQWWPWLLASATVVASSLVGLGQRMGLVRRSERVYAATVAMAVGAWLAAGTALGPSFRPLPQLLLYGGVVLAVPWWAHRRRRARVRVERKLAAWPEISAAIGLNGSRVMSAVVDVWGWRARFGLARGQTIQDVTAKIPALESALGTFRGAVRVHPTPDDKANRFELRVLDIDPHADAIPWPGPSVSSITEPIDLGPFEDATPAQVHLKRRHGLIGGATGSGKSGVINVLMGNLSACTDAVIWAIDLKRGMELQPWSACIDRLATNPEQASALLRDAVTILEGRAEWLAAHGQRVWEPTSDMPALVILIDEYAELADEAPDAISDADSIGRRGRAVAVQLIAATQRPTQKAMGRGALRSQMDVRLSFRVRERRDVDLILGQGMLSAGWHAHTLNAPGKFLISAPEHDTPRRARAYLLTDEAVSATASQHTVWRPPLDEVSRRALQAERDQPRSQRAEPPVDASPGAGERQGQGGDDKAPEGVLWSMLAGAPDEGVPIAHLMTATGMGRSWVYYRLQELAAERRACQVSRGRWRATQPTEP
ncbi:cell division protein FtsK [Actinomadura barringtoniae]|uniref:Cell division protein FtsK n=2 Tax=Actinomadura barringtoniae TaxID=1427535 RepID=A0A939PF96_9ACTN|nr:cell division protein FtsK [Actinomadura barringtoniae]